MSNFYDKNLEEKYYKICEERGYFELSGNEAIQEEGKNFCIMMPPPNITGYLHIGHALTFTLQDIMTRYKRMDGYKSLWQAGLDHAGIATQNIVEKQLLAQGIKKEDLGREEFLKKVQEWKEKSGGMILHQMKKLGISPAWSRTRFTLDEGLKSAVRKSFTNLYNKGLIVKDTYMINWCTHDGALSDIEVEHKENKGKLYHIKYFFKDSSDFLTVATTRPETFFGDSAVMVHPEDERYKNFIGKSLILPIINREIKIIADAYVDKDFGTGIVKVTPAHDINDYEVGKRHNLEFITVFDEKGILNEHCADFAGLERLEARNAIVEKLEELGNIEKIEDYDNQVGYCYRCKNLVEPYISKQWFVKKEIADKAIKEVNEGQAQFYPNHWLNNFNAWMRDLKDWCISRQLWYGHQIPVFYCRDCGNEWASEEEQPQACPKCSGKNFYQDEDVLDTWFSSGLWPISTLGWGNGEHLKNIKWFESDLKDFYPNTMLITGFDILFFWVARMMFQSENALNSLPFKDIYLHALVKDAQGKKMSKSSGNVIDPLEKIEEYSADILRFTLTLLAVQGRDIKLSEEKLIQVRNFTNKLYNASKFLLLNEEKFQDFDAEKIQTKLGRYFLSRFYACTKEVRENLDAYRFNDAANALYKFLWDEFCDWGIELSKVSKESIKELGSIFKESMKLLNPFMPFLSEFLYQELSGTTLESSPSIMISRYPKIQEQDLKLEEEFSLIIEAIISIRRAKSTIDLGNAKIKKAYIKSEKDLSSALDFIKFLAKSEEVEIVKEKISDAICDLSQNMEIFLPLNGLDASETIKRLKAQESKLEKELIKLSSMLKNEKFLAKAPEELVLINKRALENAESQLKKVKEEIKVLEAFSDK